MWIINITASPPPEQCSIWIIDITAQRGGGGVVYSGFRKKKSESVQKLELMFMLYVLPTQNKSCLVLIPGNYIENLYARVCN